MAFVSTFHCIGWESLNHVVVDGDCNDAGDIGNSGSCATLRNDVHEPVAEAFVNLPVAFALTSIPGAIMSLCSVEGLPGGGRGGWRDD